MLIFSRRFSSEKCPTIRVASVFFYVRPQNSSFMFRFLEQTLIGLRGVRVLALARNFFEHLRKRTRLKALLFQFFRHCNFFRFFFAFKGSPFKFFDILQQTELLKSPSVYILKYFRPIRLFQIKTLIFLFFSNNFFVTKGPLQLFATNWIFKKFRRSPFCHFKTPNKCVRPQPNPRFSQVCLARLKLVEAPFLTTLQVPNLSANLL